MAEQESVVVIPLPTFDNAVTYGAARLVFEHGQPYAEAIAEVPGTRFAPPRRISLFAYGLTRLREGTPSCAALYLYEGMILPGPDQES